MHLTNNDAIHSAALVESGRPDAAGAPVDVIEIAPERIEAVVRIIRAYFDQPNDWFTRAIAEEILETLEYGRR
jgi:hypothetical protein